MNKKTTIILVVLALIVGGWFLWLTRENAETGGSDAPTHTALQPGDAEPLFTAEAFPTEKVERIEITRGERRVTLAKEAGEWVQTSPVRFPLSSYLTLVDNAAALSASDKFTPGGHGRPTLEELGLAPPRAAVTFEFGGDTEPHTVKVGRTAPGGRTYVMVDDNPKVYVVDSAIHRSAVEDKVSSWRRRSLEAPTVGQAKRVTLTRGGQAIELVKTDTGWAFGAPHSGRVSEDAVRGLLTAIGGASIGEFVEDGAADPGALGLDRPATVLSVALPAAPTVTTQPATQSAPDVIKTLRIGGPTDLSQESFFATWSEGGESAATPGVVFTLSKSDIDKLSKSVDDLRDARISTSTPEQVTELRVDRARGGAIALSRGRAGWEFAPAPAPAPGRETGPSFEPDETEVAGLVESIAEAKAVAYAPDAEPTGEPEATVSLHTGKSEPEVLRVYAAAPAEGGAKPRRLVIRNNETTGYLVPADKLERLFAPVVALRDRTVLDLPRERIAKVTINGIAFERTVPLIPAAPVPATQAEKPGPWKLAGAASFEAEALESVLNQLVPLEAARWLADTGPAAPERPDFTVTLTTAEGKTHTLVINEASKAASVSGVDARFEVKPALIDALKAEFRDRTVIPWASEDIKRVTVTDAKPGVRNLIVERGEDGRFSNPDGETIDQSAAGKLFDTLGGLRAARYLERLATPTAERVLRIEGGGKSVELRLAAEGEGDAGLKGDLGEKVFSLSEEDVEALRAGVLARDAEEE